jgi:hypothetical protein
VAEVIDSNGRLQKHFAFCENVAPFYKNRKPAKVLTYYVPLKVAIDRLKSKYRDISKRTRNADSKDYKYYGARGIKCLWATSDEFVADMLPSFLDHIREHGIEQTTIERIDARGHYSKLNCKWATWKEQFSNRPGVVVMNGKFASSGR